MASDKRIKKIYSKSFVFILILIILKIIYIIIESNYNYDTLNFATRLDINIDDLENFEKLGHFISSAGITLLFIPFIYFLFKKLLKNEDKILIFTGIFSLLFYSITYFGLTYTMHTIIKKNADKRYQSYYVNILKYGMIYGSFGYEKYLDKKDVLDNSVYTKVLLNNLFLLTLIDEEVVRKVQLKGKSVTTNFFIKFYGKENLESNKKYFYESAKKIKTAFTQYNLEKKEINKKLEQIQQNSYVKSEYGKFTEKINKKYTEYRDSRFSYTEKRHNELKKVNLYYTDLKKYFKYQGNNKAEKKYTESMKKNFGKYISPSVWCSGNVCPSEYAIKNFINKEMQKEWSRKTSLPKNLKNNIEFLKHPKVRVETVKLLRKEGLIVSKDFNYSSQQFINAYNKMISNKIIEVQKVFQKEFYKKTKIKNIPMNLNWESFVRKFYPQFMKEYNSSKYANIAINMIINQDLSVFYEKLYKPMFYQKYTDKLFISEKSFSSDPQAQIYGDTAIKMLYIPPFAITLSAISGVLNLLSVIPLIIFLPFFNNKGIKVNIAKSIFKIVLLASAIAIIINNSNNMSYLKNNEAINKIDFSEHKFIQSYLVILEPIIYLSVINYYINEKFH